MLYTQIQELWNEFGFPSYDDITYHNGDKVGLLDLLGNKLTDAIYDEFSFTFDLDVFLFNYYIVAKKNGKWGWYWDNNNLYNNLQQPLYDEIYFMTQKEWETLTDDDEEFFEARIDDKIHYILMWSYK